MTIKSTLQSVALCLTAVVTDASAQIIAASHAGQYSASGNHTAGNTSYVTGAFEGEYRSFFVFDLPTFSGPIVSAKIEFYNSAVTDDSPGGFYSEDGAETLSLFHVATSRSALLAGGSGLAGIFADLGAGTAYGSTAVTESANGGYVSLFLNGAFLADLNAASGGSIAVGGALTSLTDPNGYEFVFGNTDLSSVLQSVRLTLTPSTTQTAAVPEPSTYAIFASALLGLALLRRRVARRAA
jgi:hypothetical protein